MASESDSDYFFSDFSDGDQYNNLIRTLDLSDFPPFHVWSCYHQVSYLKKWGELDVLDAENDCKLEVAVRNGDLLMVLVLLENGASHLKSGSLNLLEKGTHGLMHLDDWTPIIVAVKKEGIERDRRLEIVKFLLTFDQDLRISDQRHGRTAAHWATVHGFPDILQELLVKEPNVISRFDNGLATMMAYAISKFEATPTLSVELVYVLLENGFDVDQTDAADDTPLHLAVMASSVEIARILMRYGARTYRQNEDGDTPIQIAENMGNTRMVSVLSPGNAAAGA
jgi:ankyrin repeat protein